MILLLSSTILKHVWRYATNDLSRRRAEVGYGCIESGLVAYCRRRAHEVKVDGMWLVVVRMKEGLANG